MLIIYLSFLLQILALIEEVKRLRTALSVLQESHNTQIQRLDDREQLISRLEARLDKQSDYDDVKKENW